MSGCADLAAIDLGRQLVSHICLSMKHAPPTPHSLLVFIPSIMVQEPALRQAAVHSFLSDPPLGHDNDGREGQGPPVLRLIPAALQAAGLTVAPPQAAGDVPLYGGPRPPAAGPSQMNALGCVRILLAALGEEFWKAAVGAPSGAGGRGWSSPECCELFHA